MDRDMDMRAELQNSHGKFFINEMECLNIFAAGSKPNLEVSLEPAVEQIPVGVKFSEIIATLGPIFDFQSTEFADVRELGSWRPPDVDAICLFFGMRDSGGNPCLTQYEDYPTSVDFSIIVHPSVAEAEMRRRAEIICLKHGIRVADFDEHQDSYEHRWNISGVWTEEGILREVLDTADELGLAARTPSWPASFTPAEVLHAVRHGLIDILKGELREGECFDAKEFLDLSQNSAKVEFAKDVAQFANSTDGGLLLVGARTKKLEGGEEVFSKLAPLNKNPRLTGSPAKLAQAARDVADRYIYPAVSGISIEVIRFRDEEVLIVYIPPQASQLKPFIVHGETVSGKHFGEFFSIPMRRGDSNLPVTPKELHRLLSGRLWVS
ncbi:helix-turn-helix domain-containing protein [Streptomyces chrestomyceticus]|uniref:AlbA family DNA-binding domain-containing protein n=1 Tax=Streptomyces chrestomyceticus TaxID=68185 RepID=UPI0036975253